MSNKEIPIFKFGSLEDFDFQLGGLENANLYITSLYNWGNPDEETKQLTQEMYELSRDSMFENLEGIDAHILITNPNMNGIHITKTLACFYDTFLKSCELWKQGHNLFFAGIDTICVKPTDIFGEFDKFSMFNGVSVNTPGLQSATKWYEGFNQGYSETEKFGRIDIPVYFNCDVRYIPSNISELVWNIGFDEWRNYFEQKQSSPEGVKYLIHGEAIDGLEWGIEQVIYNIMLYEGQDWKNDYESLYRADLNNFNMQNPLLLLNAPSFEPPFPNRTPVHIYQAWGSRGLEQAISVMRKLNQ